MRSLIRFKRSDRRVQPFTGTLVVLLFICAQLSGILVSQHDANAQQKREFKKPMVREIFVPYAELETLLESQARRVYMTRKEYAELLKEAVKQAPNEPPHAASIVAADYQITLGDGRATIAAKLDIDVLKSGRVTVTLPIAGAGIRRATLDGNAAALARVANGATLFIEGQRVHQLQLNMNTPVATEAAQQTLTLALPRAASSRIAMSVPGNVEVKKGADVLSRRVDEAANITYFELVAWTGSRDITMSLNNRRFREDRAVVCRSVIVDELTEAYERLHITSSFEVLHGAVEKLRFEAPLGWEISNVSSELLAKWIVTEQDGKQIVEAELRKPVRVDVSCNILASRSNPDLANWQMPAWKPLDTVGNVAVVGLLLEDRLKPNTLESQNALPIDSTVLADALPESVLKFEPGQPQIRPAVAYYSPQGVYQIAGEITKPPARLDTVTSLLMTASDEIVRVDGAIVMLSFVERRFSADITAPAGWRITRVTGEDLKPIAFERGDDVDDVDGAPRWRVKLPAAMLPGSQLTLMFQAEPEDSGDWLGGWNEKTLNLPQFKVLGASKQIGSIAVQVDNDLAVQPGDATGLATLDDRQALERFGDAAAALAYSFQGEYALPLNFRREQPYVSGRSYSFLKLEPNRLASHLELQFSVQHARVKQLQFSLPKSTPSVISIRGLGGVTIKESGSEEVDDNRVWTARLDTPRDGTIALAVDFEETWEGEPAPEMMPATPKLLGVSYQTGLVAVEGDARLDVQIETEARVVDVGELAAAEYLPGKRLLGTYEFIGEPAGFELNVVRRTGRDIPAAIIERAEIVSVIGANGRSQTVARMELNSKAAFLEIRMPKGAKPWSVLVDGDPITPQRSGDQLLVSLPSSATTRRSIQVVYEAVIDSFDGFGRFDIDGPMLYVRPDEGISSEPIPIADLQWKILPPPGYRLTRPEGAVFRKRAPRWAPYNWLTEIRRATESTMPQVAASPWYIADDVQYNAPTESEGPMLPGDRGSALSFGLPASGADAELSAPEEEMDGLVDNIQTGRMRVREGDLKKHVDKLTTLAEGLQSRRRAEKKSELKADAPQPDDSPADPTNAPRKPRAATVTKTAEPPPTSNIPLAPGGGGLGGGAGGDGLPKPPEGLVRGGAGLPVDLAEVGGELAQGGFVPGNNKTSRQSMAWALTGLRSLPIDMQQTLAQSNPDDLVLFEGLGAEPQISAELVSQQRLDSIAWAWGCLVFAIGVVLTRASLSMKLRLIILTAALSVLAPLVVNEVDILGPIGFCGFVGALALAPYYLLASFFTWFTTAAKRFFKPAQASSATAGLLVLLLAGVASAQPPTRNWDDIFNRLANPQPVVIPKNAVVIPYKLGEDGKLQAAIDAADKVLVPYSTYVELWNRAHPDQKIDGAGPKESFAFAGADYNVELVDRDQILIHGVVNVDVYSDQPTLAPLQLDGGVLSSARVDGEPARLHTVNPQVQAKKQAANAPNAGPQQAAAPNQPAGQSILAVLLEGKGRKKIELTIRFRPERRGGWRLVEGRLPGNVSASLNLKAPKADTEVRIRGAFDRELFETTNDNQTIETALDNRKSLSIQWRPKVGETQIDRTLTAKSTAVWDVQDEGLGLTWNIELAFRQGRRDAFTLQAPLDYLVEQVTGNNVRAWRVEKEANHQRIEVTLLKAVAEKTQFSLRLSKRGAVGAGDLTEVSAPTVTAADAALHQGRIFIRRSPMIELVVSEQLGVSQTDLDAKVVQAVVDSKKVGQSPLGLRNFQAFRFSTTGFNIKLAASPVTIDKARLTAKWQTLIHIGKDSTRLETLAQIDSGDHGLHHLVFEAPSNLQVERVSAESLMDWSAISIDQTQQIHLFFLTAQRGQFAIVLSGQFADQAVGQTTPVPTIALQDASSNEGQIVVNCDTGFQVQPRNLNGLQAHPVRGSNSPALRRVQGWLSAGNKRLAQWVLDFSSGTYSGDLITTPKPPKLSATTVTNIRVTDQTIEESIMLRFVVSNAGVRNLSFTIPATMRNARIQAPTLRRKIMTPVEGDDQRIDVRLELQEELLGEIIVVVENDRLHGNGTHTAPIPIIKSADGDTFQQYITLENASRDELIVHQTGVEQMSRRTPPPELAGVNLNRAYAVRDNPVLEYESKSRAEVETVGARIELSETRLALDAAGVYRGEQVYHIDNTTEQYLEIEMPAGAKLWTAIVADEPVKPAQSSNGSQFVRIPLVKTAVGDPNFTVRLQYGGSMSKIRAWSSVAFPLIKTSKVKVELSQVRLFLPESHRWWFGESMGQVSDDSVFVKDYSNYIRQQIEKASDALNSKNAYRRARATNNLKQLGLALQSYDQGGRDAALSKEFAGNIDALRDAEAQIDNLNDMDEGINGIVDNRTRFNDFYEYQKNSGTTIEGETAGSNFSGQSIRDFNERQAKRGEAFDKGWFYRNKLGNRTDDSKKPGQSGAAKSKGKSRRLLDQSEGLQQQEAILEDRFLGKGQKLNAFGGRKQAAEKPAGSPDANRRSSRRSGVSQSNQALAQQYQERLANQSHGQTAAELSALNRQFSSERARYATEQAARDRSTAQPNRTAVGGVVIADGATRLAQRDDDLDRDVASGIPINNPLAGQLASLDIMLPMRGVEVRFTTIDKDVEIRGQGISRSLVGRISSISIIIVVLLGWLGLQRLTRFRRAARM